MMFKKIVIGTGSGALLAATLVVAANAMLRHLSVVVPGSIEIVQMIVTVIAATGLIIATLERGHALVHLLVDRLSPNSSRVLRALNNGLVCIYWLLVGFGGAWIIADYWNLNEATVLIGIPLVPFRLVWLAACVAIAAINFHRIFNHGLPKADDT
jgi:TRAP-type C4-dicarboxylate transport system permease small subunit